MRLRIDATPSLLSWHLGTRRLGGGLSRRRAPTGAVGSVVEEPGARLSFGSVTIPPPRCGRPGVATAQDQIREWTNASATACRGVAALSGLPIHGQVTLTSSSDRRRDQRAAGPLRCCASRAGRAASPRAAPYLLTGDDYDLLTAVVRADDLPVRRPDHALGAAAHRVTRSPRAPPRSPAHRPPVAPTLCPSWSVCVDGLRPARLLVIADLLRASVLLSCRRALVGVVTLVHSSRCPADGRAGLVPRSSSRFVPLGSRALRRGHTS